MIFDFFSFLGGLSCKLYDDFNDNPLFSNFKDNKFLMELLKGLHYLAYISVGMEDNLFYILYYIANIGNYLLNSSAFSEPYENSVIYTFLLGFFLLNYTKVFETIKSIKIYSIDTISLLLLLFFGWIEVVIINDEVSFNKFYMRILGVMFFLASYFMSEIKTFKFLFIYIVGYLICSCIVQYISLTKIIVSDDKISTIDEKCKTLE